MVEWGGMVGGVLGDDGGVLEASGVVVGGMRRGRRRSGGVVGGGCSVAPLYACMYTFLSKMDNIFNCVFFVYLSYVLQIVFQFCISILCNSF